MISLILTPTEMLMHIRKQAQAKRLSMNFSQRTLSARAGVSYGVIKKFERTGQISFESLLKIALPLEVLEDFYGLFNVKESQQVNSLDDLIGDKTRKRGRK